MNILFILVLEVNRCLVWLWGHLSPLCWTISSSNLLKPPLYSFRLSPCFWGRFMDDVICIWKHGLESLDLFQKHLNSFDKNVKLTLEFEENDNLLFLDILLIKIDFHLLFSVFRKPTHSYRYLNFQSCHPISVKRGVVITLVDRAFRICSQKFLDSELLYLRDIYFVIVTQLNSSINNKKIDALNTTIGLLGFHSVQN